MKKRSAFTLVELLVVIGIIAILISLLLPALNKARQQANDLACMSTLRQFQLMSFAYSNNNKGYFVPILPGALDTPATWWSEATETRKALGITPYNEGALYGPANRRLICPNATLSLTNGYCKDLYPIRQCYGMNFQDFIDPSIAQLYMYSTPAKSWIAYKVSWIKQPSAKLAWADAIFPWIRITGSSQYVGEFVASGTNNVIAYRHRGGVNVVFFDGHGEWLSRAQVDYSMMTTAQTNKLWYATK